MKRYAKEIKHCIRIRLNGVHREGLAESRTLLSDFLRYELGATGTHVGCEHGVCGACTVRIDGVPARACLTLAAQVDGRSVHTVEGLAPGSTGHGALGALQEAFRAHHALQCGFCTPGILVSASAWIESVAAGEIEPNQATVREMLSGHLCRCTGYKPIVDAVLYVARAALSRPAQHPPNRAT